MEEETWNPLEVRDLMTRVASGVDPEETTPWEQVAPRQIDGADLLRFEGYVTASRGGKLGLGIRAGPQEQ
jgi:hypothetical protein